MYGVNKNWVHFSRDLFGLPRRVLIDFDLPESARDNPAVAVIGWATWTTVLVVTATLVRLRADRTRLVGLGAGFALLGAFLCCYRFMYYDATLAFLAVAVLMGDPRPGVRWSVAGFLATVYGYENFGLHFVGTYTQPVDTLLFLTLWVICGVWLLSAGDRRDCDVSDDSV